GLRRHNAGQSNAKGYVKPEFKGNGPKGLIASEGRRDDCLQHREIQAECLEREIAGKGRAVHLLVDNRIGARVEAQVAKERHPCPIAQSRQQKSGYEGQKDAARAIDRVVARTEAPETRLGAGRGADEIAAEHEEDDHRLAKPSGYEKPNGDQEPAIRGGDALKAEEKRVAQMAKKDNPGAGPAGEIEERGERRIPQVRERAAYVNPWCFARPNKIIRICGYQLLPSIFVSTKSRRLRTFFWVFSDCPACCRRTFTQALHRTMLHLLTE